MSENNIYQRINAVRKKVAYVKKDTTVKEGGGYQAVTHDAVTSMLRDALIENGIVVTMSVSDSSIKDTGTTTARGTPFIRYEARYIVSFTNADKPDDHFDMIVESHALDTGDKAPGKAMSYAKKYAMLKTFEIETGEDDEGRQEQHKPKKEPTSEAYSEWDRLDDETKEWMLEESMSVGLMLSKNDIEGAYTHLEELQLDADYKTAFWSRLDSKQRSALKSYGSIIRARSEAELINAWGKVPNHSKGALLFIKDKRKEELTNQEKEAA